MSVDNVTNNQVVTATVDCSLFAKDFQEGDAVELKSMGDVVGNATFIRVIDSGAGHRAEVELVGVKKGDAKLPFPTTAEKTLADFTLKLGSKLFWDLPNVVKTLVNH